LVFNDDDEIVDFLEQFGKEAFNSLHRKIRLETTKASDWRLPYTDYSGAERAALMRISKHLASLKFLGLHGSVTRARTAMSKR
jgi:hypothetical protein